MLCIINKAWVDILARQIKSQKIKKALCVYTNLEERQIILDTAQKYNIGFSLLDIPEYSVKELIENETIDLINFDDILISHDIYDVFVKDYLAKHCKRINKNLH